MELLIHGVFDATTLKTLQALYVPAIGFDLRGKSLNLIPFHVLKSFIPSLKTQKCYLTFENDKVATVVSFLSLLGNEKDKFELEFRDTQHVSYYASIPHPFTWFFHPEGDWENILTLPQLKALVLPVKYKEVYQNLPHLWQMIQARDLKVILHVESFEDLELYVQDKNLNLSVDLGKEMEIGFRQIDQFRLMNLSIWRTNYEIASGQ
ncbi:MAG: hypothetical protein H0V66_04460 [Bdellovibrionales bacterium]|nr:hypothetical protein [Bdellovibrionales bacterium]